MKLERIDAPPFDRSRNWRFFAYVLTRPFCWVPGLATFFVGAWFVSTKLHGSPQAFALLPLVALGAALLLGLGGLRLSRGAKRREPSTGALGAWGGVLATLPDHLRHGHLVLGSDRWRFVPGRMALCRDELTIPLRRVKRLAWFETETTSGVVITARNRAPLEIYFSTPTAARDIVAIVSQLPRPESAKA